MDKSTIIYGPPGTGKSTEIIKRMQGAVSRGTPVDRIGLVSFTRAAAHELAKRAGVPPGKNISTLHSYAFRICGLIREQVVDRNKLLTFSKVSKIETTGANVYDQENLGAGDHYLSMYGYMRSSLITDTKEAFYAGNREGSLVEFQYFVKAYERWKEAHGYVDFSDMLTECLSKPAPDLDLLFLDEAQDFSPAQWLLIEHWVPHIKEMVLALDDDQTLYKFNGADPDGGPAFERKHRSERRVLNKSYRVPAEIHALANKLIHNVSHRVDKEYHPVDQGGQINRYGNIRAVPKPTASDEVLVLFRNHSLRTEIEEWLIDSGIPYLTDNGRKGPLQAALGAAILAWEQAQENLEHTGQDMLPPRSWALLRKLALPVYKRDFNAEDMTRLEGKKWYQVLRAPNQLISYHRKLERNYGTAVPGTKVRLSTIHGAKGREADRVILLNGMSQNTAEACTHDPDPEIRCFYVGVTRARHRLDIVSGDNPLHLLR